MADRCWTVVSLLTLTGGGGMRHVHSPSSYPRIRVLLVVAVLLRGPRNSIKSVALRNDVEMHQSYHKLQQGWLLSEIVGEKGRLIRCLYTGRSFYGKLAAKGGVVYPPPGATVCFGSDAWPYGLLVGRKQNGEAPEFCFRERNVLI